MARSRSSSVGCAPTKYENQGVALHVHNIGRSAGRTSTRTTDYLK
ncbi:hypothetical protein B005_2997 [Nocardiopsis alba ATCC BAA-2165]|uniref:Uncharacterized protein n=1 Tax=Nocardiopsis alba (strain ATCC BAA-2165 / BE74) TaxID=1205910 RepID=J7LAZ0_NOCAA|nr:hypothetical protein B005_2997 [Nocardiopsis alba ATCC BAA-2165]